MDQASCVNSVNNTTPGTSLDLPAMCLHCPEHLVTMWGGGGGGSHVLLLRKIPRQREIKQSAHNVTLTERELRAKCLNRSIWSDFFCY